MPEYRVSGFTIASSLELPAPTTGPVLEGPPLRVEFGRAPELADATRIGPTLQVAGPVARLAVPGLAAFLVRDGQTIRIDPEDGDASDLAGLLLGPVLALACHQRGLLPVHASAVRVGDGCAVFVGRAAVGRSTVAAALAGRGHPLVADDLCVIHLNDEGEPYAYPAAPAVRLWPDGIAGLDIDRPGIVAIRPNHEKRSVPFPAAREPVRVRHVVVIDPKGEGREFGRRVGLDAVSVLLATTWHRRAVEPMGLAASHFARCAGVAKRAAIWHWARPQGIERLPGVLSGLESAWRDAAREAR